jgi:hypothetical protein
MAVTPLGGISASATPLADAIWLVDNGSISKEEEADMGSWLARVLGLTSGCPDK